MAGFMRTVLAAAAGATIAYLFDPVSGRTRRARLSDQAAARARRAAEETETRARYEMGRAKGALHDAGRDTDFPADDAELLQKVRSEAVGPSDISTADIEIHVDGGEVVIRGMSRDQAAERELVTRIQQVTGVRAVRNELTSV